MNKLTLPQSNFALTSDALKVMQDAAAIIEKLAAVGGDNYILSGVEDQGGGTSYSDGFVVLNGIVMPFVGGSHQSTIKIVKTVQTVNVDTATRQETTYHAEFGTTSTTNYQFDFDTLDAKRIGDGFVDHIHTIANVTDLQSTLDARVAKGKTMIKAIAVNAGSTVDFALVRVQGGADYEIADSYQMSWADAKAAFDVEGISIGEKFELG